MGEDNVQQLEEEADDQSLDDRGEMLRKIADVETADTLRLRLQPLIRNMLSHSPSRAPAIAVALPPLSEIGISFKTRVLQIPPGRAAEMPPGDLCTHICLQGRREQHRHGLTSERRCPWKNDFIIRIPFCSI